MDESEEDAIYQLYTVINDTNSLTQNNEDQPIFLLTFKNEDEAEDNQSVTFESDEKSQEEQEDNTSSFLSNLKLITFDDGRMYVTTTNADEEDLKTVEPHLISCVTNEEIEKQESEPVVNEEKEANEVDDAGE